MELLEDTFDGIRFFRQWWSENCIFKYPFWFSDRFSLKLWNQVKCSAIFPCASLLPRLCLWPLKVFYFRNIHSCKYDSKFHSGTCVSKPINWFYYDSFLHICRSYAVFRGPYRTKIPYGSCFSMLDFNSIMPNHLHYRIFTMLLTIRIFSIAVTSKMTVIRQMI